MLSRFPLTAMLLFQLDRIPCRRASCDAIGEYGGQCPCGDAIDAIDAIDDRTHDVARGMMDDVREWLEYSRYV